MTNFDIFNKEILNELIEPFVKGMAGHITPIKYEAITPDIFALLFRTTGKDSDNKPEDHYFVSLEFDYIESGEEAKRLIEEWHGGKVIIFLNPGNGADSGDPRVNINATYQALLAKVERPRGPGYWASNEIISSPDEIEAFVSKLNDTQREKVRVSLEGIFKDYPGVSISAYIHPDGRTEYFYN